MLITDFYDSKRCLVYSYESTIFLYPSFLHVLCNFSLCLSLSVWFHSVRRISLHNFPIIGQICETISEGRFLSCSSPPPPSVRPEKSNNFSRAFFPNLALHKFASRSRKTRVRVTRFAPSMARDKLKIDSARIIFSIVERFPVIETHRFRWNEKYEMSIISRVLRYPPLPPPPPSSDIKLNRVNNSRINTHGCSKIAIEKSRKS